MSCLPTDDSFCVQAAEAEVVDSLDDSVDSESDELFEEFEEVKRARSLSSIFTSEDDVLQVDAAQTDESLAVMICSTFKPKQSWCCAPLSLLLQHPISPNLFCSAQALPVSSLLASVQVHVPILA